MAARRSTMGLISTGTFGPTGPTSPTFGTPTSPTITTSPNNILPGGNAPGAVACGLAGLPSSCSWGDLANAGAAALIGRGGGSGSEPPSGDTPVPGNFGPAPSGGGSGPCNFPAVQIGGKCVDVTAAAPGGDPFVYPADGAGEAVMGRYGVALTPTIQTIQRAKCLPGMVLGKDGLCYERLRKDERKWNPGTKPLLTGGEMNAIRKAKRAAGRLSRTQKGLKKTARALEKAC